MSQPSAASRAPRPRSSRRPRRRPAARGCGRGRSSSGRSTASFSSSSMFRTNDLSIFSSSTREPLEVAERRVAGAEVVDREPDPELAERAAARASARVGSAMIVLSVISSIEPRRRARSQRVEQRADRRPGARRRAGCAPTRLTATQTLDALVAPTSRHCASAASSTCSVSGRISAGVLGERDELVGRRAGRARDAASARAPRRRAPRPLRQVGLGLVVEDELVLGDRAAQLGHAAPAGRRRTRRARAS